MLNEASQLVKL